MKKIIDVVIFVIVLCVSNTSLFAGSENCHGLYSPGNRYGCEVGHGNCTWYAAYRRPDLNFPTSGSHDAGTWINHAKKLGFVIGNIPVPGAVAVINMGSVGHVAYVEERYQGPITVDHGVPFIAKEQDYSGSLPYQLGDNKVYTAIYAFSHNGYYRRQNSASGFGSENEVYGFIYPTFTMQHPYGRLVMMRKDGKIPESCNDADRGAFYHINYDKELTVTTHLSQSQVERLCTEALDFYHEWDITYLKSDLAVYMSNRRGEVLFDGNGGGNGGGGSDDGSSSSEDDISIISCKTKIYGETDYQHSVTKTAMIDEYFKIDAEAIVKNKSDYDSYDTDIDYRVDHHKNKFDSNDTKLSEDTVDIPAGNTITKHMGRTTVHVSHDGNTITVSKGSHHETFDVINGKASFYIFLDVENRGDKDISSETKHGEYAKVTVIVQSKPTGIVQSASGGIISGWANDPDTTQAIDIHIYRDNQFIAVVKASPNFKYVLPSTYRDGKNHEYKIYAINVPKGQNPLLTDGQFNMSIGNNGAMPTTRFYSSSNKAHYFNIDPVNQSYVPRNYNHVWKNEGYSFNAFPTQKQGTIPLYTCWSIGDKTHHYFTSKVSNSFLQMVTSCEENANGEYLSTLFYVYKEGGENRIPVYEMKKHQGDNYTIILSNGELDAYNLRDYHGFSFVTGRPMFWAPSTLVTNVTIPTPRPSFTFWPHNAQVPKTVWFTNHTTSATSWYWDFGDGYTSRDKNPHHYYASAGNYTVKLIAANQTKTATTRQTVTLKHSPMESLRSVYRFYCYSMKSHFFTISSSEKSSLSRSHNWKYEGIVFKAHYKYEVNTVPIFRFYHKNKGHFYTASVAERNGLWGKRDWKYEGISFWAYSWNYPGTSAVYRLWSSKNQSHFYTKSWAEVESAKRGGGKYRYEGIAFWTF